MIGSAGRARVVVKRPAAGWMGANYVSVFVVLFCFLRCMHVLKIAVRLVWRVCVCVS